MELIYTNHLNFYKKCPLHLQHKVWFDLVYYLGRRGQEGIHIWKKEHFGLGKTAEGRKYIYMKINDVTKKSQGDESSISRERVIYLEKLNKDYKFFWQ